MPFLSKKLEAQRKSLMKQMERSSAANTKAIDELRHYATHVFNSGLTFLLGACKGSYSVVSDVKESTPAPRSDSVVDG